MTLPQPLIFASLVICSPIAGAATIINFIGPVTVSSGVAVNININPSVDAVDDVVFYVRDFGGVATLNASGLPGNTVAVTAPPPGDNVAVRLGVGDTVSPVLNFGGNFGGNVAAPPSLATELPGNSVWQWGGGQSGYLGVSFQSGGSTHYGFIHVTWVPDNDPGAFDSVAVIDYVGFNDIPGAPVTIIPEPSSAILLSTIVVGMFRRRR